jgi:hypothetical protein
LLFLLLLFLLATPAARCCLLAAAKAKSCKAEQRPSSHNDVLRLQMVACLLKMQQNPQFRGLCRSRSHAREQINSAVDCCFISAVCSDTVELDNTPRPPT